jgi:hypothetical protein
MTCAIFHGKNEGGADMAKAKLRRGRGKGISPIDAHVGARVRQRRTLLGMSQKKLAEAAQPGFVRVTVNRR